jgi:acyl carrier protein
MEHTEAADIIVSVLSGIAPEIDPQTVDRTAELQFEFDLDSMDFLNLVEGVGKAAGLDIPERDYAAIATFDDFAGYIVAHAG